MERGSADENMGSGSEDELVGDFKPIVPKVKVTDYNVDTSSLLLFSGMMVIGGSCATIFGKMMG